MNMKKFSLVNNDPMLKMSKNSLLSLPTPASISFLWNGGFLLGVVLMLQIITGLLLSMSYIAFADLAFFSVNHIMRDVGGGWLMRYLHMNGASFYFFLMYSHIFRGLFFDSGKKSPMVWLSGVLLFLASMGAAFVGYVLPWGQMSFWGASVITSMISAIPYIGKEVTHWVWGNFSVSQPTLNRFFSFHFLIPLVLVVIVMAHLLFLHEKGSSNPLGANPNYDKIKFFPYFLVKDMTPLFFFMLAILVFVSLSPNVLGDVENWTPAMTTTTPVHIQPEWYFLFAYAILRSIPSKLGGVSAMLFSIILLVLPSFKKNLISKKFSLQGKVVFWLFVQVALLLTWIGANAVESPFIMLGQLLTLAYFFLILLI